MTPVKHPDQRLLAAFAEGNVDDDQHESIREHLQTCQLCNDLVLSLENAGFEGLRLPKSTEMAPSVVEPPLHEALTLCGTAGVKGSPSLSAIDFRVDGVLPIGTTVRYFGDYELLSEIARGGMGVVYKARQVSLNRIVALKMILSGQLASKDDVRRFHAEAEAAASLDHPGIVPIYEVGEHAGQHYFSMGFVDGISLSKRVADGPLPPREAAELLVQIAEAVQYAHDKGIIHRDLKPANILLQILDPRISIAAPSDNASSDPSDRGSFNKSRIEKRKSAIPKVTDFGLAKRVTGGSDLTNTGQVLGTPSYMPPEQAAGKLNEIGPLSDVYSLGAILYTLLVGRPPFQAASPLETLLQVLERDPIAPSQLNAGVPRDLETIALKCLEKDASRRFGSAQLMADDLNRWLNHEPIQARPSTVWERLLKWSKRRPGVATLSLFLAVALLTGSVVSAIFGLVANRERIKAVALSTANANLAEQEKSAREKANRKAVEARASLYVSNIRLAAASWEANAIGPMSKALENCRPVQGERDLRGWEWNYLWNLSHSELLTLQKVCGPVAFSPDGNWIVCGGHPPKVWDAKSGEERCTIQGSDAYGHLMGCVAFSPDGKRIVTGDGFYGKINVWDATNGQETLALKGHSRPVTSVSFSPDGKWILSGSDDTTVKVWDAESGEESFVLVGHKGRVTSASYSPDGMRIVSGSREEDGTIKVWDVVHRQNVLTFERQRFVYCVAFSPDGTRIVSGGDKLKIWDAKSGAETLVLKGQTSQVRFVSFTPDGKHIVSGNRDATVKVWDAESGEAILVLKGQTGSMSFSLDGKRIVGCTPDGMVKVWDAKSGQESLALHGPSVFSASFSPDSKRIVSSRFDNTLTVWDTVCGQEIRTIQGHTGFVGCVSFSLDGKRFVSGSRDKTLRVWDAESGKELAILHGHTGEVTSLSFSANGKQIVSTSREGDGTVRVWDLESGQSTLTFRKHEWALGVAFSPDGKRIVSGGDKLILWDAITGQVEHKLDGHKDYVSSVAFSQDGQRIVSASQDHTLIVWGAVSGLKIHTLMGHTAGVTSVSFSPDRKRIVSGSEDNTIKVWDTESGQEMVTIMGHSSVVESVSFNSNGKLIVSGSYDGTVKVWDGRPETESKERAIEREARTALALHPARIGGHEELVSALNNDPTLSAPARQKTLTWAAMLTRKWSELPENPPDLHTRVKTLLANADSAAGNIPAELLGEATLTADKLRKFEPVNFYNLYNAGCCFGLCLKGLVNLDVPDKDRLKAELQTDAIECLKSAIAAGFRDGGLMSNDGDLEELRELPEFQTLQKRLQPIFSSDVAATADLRALQIPREPQLIYAIAQGGWATQRFDGKPRESWKLDSRIPLPVTSIGWKSGNQSLFVLSHDQLFSVIPAPDEKMEELRRFPVHAHDATLHPLQDRLAWCRRPNNSGPELIVSKLDGTKETNLGFGYDPIWTADGQKLIYTGSDGTDWVIVVREGAESRSLEFSAHPSGHVYPAPSPDGQQVAFAMKGDDGTMQIGLMSIDGTDTRQLTNTDDGNTRPIFSADGRHIAFIRGLASPACVVIIDLQTGVETIIANDAAPIRPVWLVPSPVPSP